MAIPTPLRVGGTLEYLILFLTVAKETIAKKNPSPDPKPKTVDSIKSYSLSTKNKEVPKIEQFTVMRGERYRGSRRALEKIYPLTSQLTEP